MGTACYTRVNNSKSRGPPSIVGVAGGRGHSVAVLDAPGCGSCSKRAFCGCTRRSRVCELQGEGTPWLYWTLRGERVEVGALPVMGVDKVGGRVDITQGEASFTPEGPSDLIGIPAILMTHKGRRHLSANLIGLTRKNTLAPRRLFYGGRNNVVSQHLVIGGGADKTWNNSRTS